MARRHRRSRSLKGLGAVFGMSTPTLLIGAAVGAVAMHFYMKKKDTVAVVTEKAEKAIEAAGTAASAAQGAAAAAADAASTAAQTVNGLGAMTRYSRSRSNRCVPSLCAQGLTVYCC